MEPSNGNRPALVLAGGVGLGAYQAGAYEELQAHGVAPGWFTGSSAGAVNAALIAGNPLQARVPALRRYWLETQPLFADWVRAAPMGGDVRHLWNWLSAIRSRLIGSPGHFRPRLPGPPFSRFRSLYDLQPTRERLRSLIDFDLLNSGEARVSVATTDIESGEPVIFDTAAGHRIELDHLLASCGFLPEFAPLEIDGRLLGDGGLSINAPVEVVLGETDSPPPYVLIVDLFARDGSRPASLEAALARKNDLIFSNQTILRLEAFERGRKAAGAAHAGPPVLYLSYRALPEEAGPEKAFDLSRPTAEDRWQVGCLDMREALRRLKTQTMGGAVHVIRRPMDRKTPARVPANSYE